MGYATAEGLLAMPSGDDRLQRMTVVDENQEFVDLLKDVLFGKFVVAGCGQPSIAAIIATRPDVVLFDPWTADHGNDGWSFIDRVRGAGPLSDVPIIVCSTVPLEDDGGLERLRNLADVYFISKPFALDQLEHLLNAAGNNA